MGENEEVKGNLHKVHSEEEQKMARSLEETWWTDLVTCRLGDQESAFVLTLSSPGRNSGCRR